MTKEPPAKPSFVSEDHPRGISRHSFHFFSGTLISRLSGGVRDLAMAFCFGAHPAIAALMVAYRFANVFRRLFGESTTTTVFAPHFEAKRKEEKREGALFFRDLFFSIALSLLLLVLTGEIALFLLTKLIGFSPETTQILWLTALMFPGLFFVCLYGACGALLQCEKRFFLPAVSPLAFNILWIGGIAFLWKGEMSFVAQGLAVAICLAFFAQWALTVPASFKYLHTHLSVQEMLKPTLFSPAIRQVLRPFLFAIIGISAVQLNSTIDAIFARFASLEGPAYLWYAIRLQQVPLALFGVAIASALLPPLSRAMEINDLARYKTLLHFALKRGFALVFPCTVALIVLGPSGVNLLYGHGEFSQETTYRTIECLWGYAIGLIPMIFVLILAPAFYAKKEVKIPMRASLISVACNIVLNAFFIFEWQGGACSIAIATSLSACVNFYLLHRALKKRVLHVFDRATYISFWKIALCSLSAGVITLLISHSFCNDHTLKMLLGEKELLFPRAISKQMALFGTLLFTYGFLFLAHAKMLKVQEILELIPGMKKKETTTEIT